jgi:two-component system sensor histidine kinase KdpD
MTEEPHRLDPDELLHRIKQKEKAEVEKKGYLKIFFGYAAGVGKTYRMLNEAQHLITAGHDVFAVIVETHGRKDIEVLLSRIPAIPKKQIKYDKIMLEEMDLDEVLRRKPEYVLVDELAHTNMPGSRHEKRYQDIEELLKAGINVYTTLNVQHLESINYLVYQITGIRVKETVPDQILQMADKIELVDLPTEELLQRLQEGKVYIPEKARTAILKFFKESNLLALREIALRYTAHRVDYDIVSYKTEYGIKEVLPTGSKLLVCISPSYSSADIIRTAHRFADELSIEWFAVYVESTHHPPLKLNDQLQLDKNLNLAREMGATIAKLSGDRIANEVIAFARAKNVSFIIIGFSKRSKLEEFIRGSIVSEIVQKSNPIQVLVVPGKHERQKLRPDKEEKKTRFNFVPFLMSIASVAVTTGLCIILRPFLNVHDIVLLFVIPIVLTSVATGLLGGIFASIFAVACFNFFFIPPLHTFAINDVRFLLTFAVLLFAGAVTSFLSNIVKRQAENAKRREKFVQILYEFSQKLLSTSNLSSLIHIIVINISELFEAEVVLLLGENGKISISAKSDPAGIFGEHEIGIAQWSFQNGKRAGFGTHTLTSSQWQFSPLAFQGKTIGVLALKPQSPEAMLTFEKQHLLESFFNIVALSLKDFY